MTSRTGNPYRLPTRISIWRSLLRTVSRGAEGVGLTEEDIIAGSLSIGAVKAEDVAAWVYECLLARNAGDAECLDASSDAAGRWLTLLDKAADEGLIKIELVQCHRGAWSHVEVIHKD